MTLFVTRYFMEFLKLADGGGDICISKKQYTLRYMFIYKSNSICVSFLYAKTMHCVLRLYLYFLLHRNDTLL